MTDTLKDTIIRMEVDPLLRLSLVEEIIKKKKFVVPVPHRKTLVAWIEEGKWMGEKGEDGWWYVRQSSFMKRAISKQPAATV